MLLINNRPERILEFWSWFDEHKFHYMDDEDDWDPDLFILQEKLESIDLSLRLEIESDTQDNYHLIISAMGFLESFPLVKEVVAKAPDIQGWKIIPFKQPLGEQFTIQNQYFTLDSDDLHFWPFWDDENLDIILYAADIKGTDEDILLYYAREVVIYCIGEYDTATKVRYCFFYDYEEAIEDTILPLNQLKPYIDSHFNNYN